jgi:hypothetical protein
VVYAKPPFGGLQRVLEYLGRYTHRVAISNQRLLSLEDGQVKFQWKDYRNEHREKSRTQRIRHYGFLANCHRADKLEFCRQVLTPGPPGYCRNRRNAVR